MFGKLSIIWISLITGIVFCINSTNINAQDNIIDMENYYSIVFKADEKKYYTGHFNMSNYLNGYVDLNEYQSGEYNEHSVLKISSYANLITENGQVAIDSIQEKANSDILVIYAGSNLKIDTSNDYGIMVSNLHIDDKGYHNGNLVNKSYLDVNAKKIGIYVKTVFYSNYAEIKTTGGFAGISNVTYHGEIQSNSNYLFFKNSDISSYSTLNDSIAIQVMNIALYSSSVDAKSENGIGAIKADHIYSTLDDNNSSPTVINVFSKFGTVIDCPSISIYNTRLAVLGEYVEAGINSYDFNSIHNNQSIKDIYLKIDLISGIGIKCSKGYVKIENTPITINIDDGIGILSSYFDYRRTIESVDQESAINIKVNKGYGIISNTVNYNDTIKSNDDNNFSITVNAVSKNAQGIAKSNGYTAPTLAAIVGNIEIYITANSKAHLSIDIPTNINDSYGIYIANNIVYLKFLNDESSLNIKGNTGIYAKRLYIDSNSKNENTIYGENIGISVNDALHINSGKTNNFKSLEITGKDNSAIVFRSSLASTFKNSNVNIIGAKYGIKAENMSSISLNFNKDSVFNVKTTDESAVAGIYITKKSNQGNINLSYAELNAESNGKGIYTNGVNWGSNNSKMNSSIISAIAPHNAFEAENGNIYAKNTEINAVATKVQPDIISIPAYYAQQTMISDNSIINETYETRTFSGINITPSFPYAQNLNIHEYENYNWDINPIISFLVTNNGISTSEIVNAIKLHAQRSDFNSLENIDIQDGTHNIYLNTYASNSPLFNVIFDANGGNFADNSTKVIKEDIKDGIIISTIEPSSPKREGYTFEYWYSKDENIPFDMNSKIDDNLILYAKWSKNSTEEKDIIELSVTYLGNGNTSGKAPESKTIEKNEKIVISNKNTLVRDGYIFVGWNTKADGNGDIYEVGSKIELKTNLVLYAQWAKLPESGNNLLYYGISIAFISFTGLIIYFRKDIYKIFN